MLDKFYYIGDYLGPPIIGPYEWNAVYLINPDLVGENLHFERNFSNAYCQTTTGLTRERPRSESGESAIAGFIYHTRTKVPEGPGIQAEN